MISRLTPAFRRCLRGLTVEEQSAARRSYRLFAGDPSHNSLYFKKLAGHATLWSVRVTLNMRAVGHRDGDTVYCVWIGRHAEFDQRFG